MTERESVPSNSESLSADVIDMLARELIDPAIEEFSIPLDNEDFQRVLERADALELELLDAA